MPSLPVSAIFGVGTTYNNGVLTIPLNNLGINTVTNSAIATAVILNLNSYFQSQLVDSDGVVLEDGLGHAIALDFNPEQMTVNSQLARRSFLSRSLSNHYEVSFFYQP